LGLGTLDLGGGDVHGKAGPLAEGEVDKVIELGEVGAGEVDTPETVLVSECPWYCFIFCFNSPSV
jgi:hypothetical protein